MICLLKFFFILLNILRKAIDEWINEELNKIDVRKLLEKFDENKVKYILILNNLFKLMKYFFNLFRLLAIKYRIKYPIQFNNSFNIDDNIKNKLDEKICNSLLKYNLIT